MYSFVSFCSFVFIAGGAVAPPNKGVFVAEGIGRDFIQRQYLLYTNRKMMVKLLANRLILLLQRFLELMPMSFYRQLVQE